MKKIYFLILLILPLVGVSQNLNFQPAYQNHAAIPAGVLESVAWTRTHFKNIDQSYMPSCTGMPLPYGVMGLFDNGANYFIENGTTVAQLSGVSVAQQRSDVDLQIEAYAAAFESLYTDYSNLEMNKRIYAVLIELSEIPDSGGVNLYARDAQVFEVMRNLKDLGFAQEHGFQPHHINLKEVFGEENYKVLAAQKVMLNETSIQTNNGAQYQPFILDATAGTKTAQYGPALWAATPSCNRSSRSGTSISAITIHTTQGSYSGTISWAQNCNSNVSYHYVIRSNDGQVTQMVLEEDKAWHVGSANPYTIGYEHEGYVNDPSWYTNAQMQSSADLSRDVTNSGYGISPLRTYFGPSSTGSDVLGACTKIKGLQHFPN